VGDAMASAECTKYRSLLPDQNRWEERAQFSSSHPCRNPRPSPHWFPRWARRSVGRGQSLCDGCGAKPFKFRPPDFGPSIKMMRYRG
jgi:hypothetical protein